MSSTRAQLRNNVYKRDLGFGFASTASSVSAQAIVDAAKFTGVPPGNFKGRYIYRPLVTSTANQIRDADLISTTSLTHLGLAYSGDTTVLDYEVMGRIHPDGFNEAIRQAVRIIYFPTIVPVNLPPGTGSSDDDFASSSATTPYDWTAQASNTTVTKSSTAANNRRGTYSLICTNSGANGRTRSCLLDVNPGDVLIHGGAVRATTGSAIYRLLDVTHSNAELGTAITITSQASQRFIRQDTIPAGCYQVRRQLEGSGASDVTVWDYLFSHLQGVESRDLLLPSWLSEKWRLSDFGPAQYGRSLATGVFNASSQLFTVWEPEADYTLYPLTEESSPYHLEIKRPGGLGFEDYWYHGLRPFSDIVAMDDETDATNAPEDLVMAALWYCLAEYRDDNPQWQTILETATAKLNANRRARGRTRPKRTFSYNRIGAGVGSVW